MGGQAETEGGFQTATSVAGRNRQGPEEVGFGLATGGDDPRSTNQTLEAAFSTPDLRLDYAYALFRPVKEILFWGGKYSGIKKALWRPTDLLWEQWTSSGTLHSSFSMK